ncbi:MAG: 6-phosphogluconolactonase [Chloroflexota bacterium]|nr:6-phosphogluconolactonase [Chloroflexota bacterium]
MTDDVRTLDYGDRGRVIVVADADALANMAANLLLTSAEEATAAGHRALIALSGGSTPKKMGELLAVAPLIERIPWGNLDIFWGDERWVPLADPESNAGKAMRDYLDQAPISSDHIHPFATEGVAAEDSAAAMEQLVRDIQTNAGVPAFDLILLGMGDDGHTASLFPGTAAVHETDRLVVSHHVSKLDATRLTFTPPLINAALKVAFLVGGEGKAEMVAKVLEGPIDVDAMPAQVIRPANGHLTWLVDEAAASSLSGNTAHG